MDERLRPPGAQPPREGGREAPGDAALDAAARAARDLRVRLEAVPGRDVDLPPLAGSAPGRPAHRDAADVVRVVAGRFATLAELGALERGLAALGDVHLESLWSGWAELELRLARGLAPWSAQALADELRALAPAGALVGRRPDGAFVVELAAGDPPTAIPLDAAARRPPRARPPELAAPGAEAVRAFDPAERDRALVLALGTGSPFWSLRGVRPEPALFALVPLDVAERALALPLVLAPGWLTVAAAAPEPALGELSERHPQLRLEVAVASRAELREALALARAALR